MSNPLHPLIPILAQPYRRVGLISLPLFPDDFIGKDDQSSVLLPAS